MKFNATDFQGHIDAIDASYFSDSSIALDAACDYIVELVETVFSLGEQWYSKELEQGGFESCAHFWSRLSDIVFDFVFKSKASENSASLAVCLVKMDQSSGEFRAHLEQLVSGKREGFSQAPQLLSKLKNALNDYPAQAAFEVDFDIDYAGEGNSKQCLDVYRTAGSEATNLPVILYFHGGAWEFGDRFAAIKRWRLYKDQPCIFVSVGYRLSGEVTWPAPMDDCVTATRFVLENACQWGGDASRISLWGSSAGSHLAALLAGNCRVDQPFKFQFFVNQCAPLFLSGYVEYLQGDERGSSPVMKLLGGESDQLLDFAAEATVTNWVTSAYPASCIVHGDSDLTVPYQESVKFAELLEQSGVDNQLFIIKQAPHRLDDYLLKNDVKAFLAPYLRAATA